MTLAHIAISLAFSVDLIYGMVVFLTNPRRATNQHYATLTIFLGAWLVSQWNLLNSSTAVEAERWIRVVLASTLFIPVAFNAIRLSMKYREMSWGDIVLRCRNILFVSVAVCIWCFLPASIVTVILPQDLGIEGGVAEPIFGPGYFFFKLYHVVFLFFLVHVFVRDTRNARGIWRTELQYLMFGCGVCIALAVLLGMIIPELTGNSRTAPLAPVSVILMNIIIAYGIATQRIMGVATIMRRITAYGLLTGYLVMMYQLTLWGSAKVVGMLEIPMVDLPHLLAALIVAFSLAPVHGKLQKIADLLFVRARTIDVAQIVQQASAVTQSIATLDDLLEDFARIVRSNLGTNYVSILVSSEGGYHQAYPLPESESSISMLETDPVVLALAMRTQPIVLDTMRRQRLSPLLSSAMERILDLNVVVAVGIRAKNQLSGVMLLGERLSGRIYTAQEEDALSILAAELGVALDNAKLFTEASNSRLYNDILLDNLGNGMIAAGVDLRLTAVNREAQRILRLKGDRLIGASIDSVPRELADIMRHTLENSGQREELDVPVHLDAEHLIHIRVTSSLFHGHTGEVLGAMVVFQDVTKIKHLQVQIRRSDRLASMGTLSAGMAHEIKNPLVTIKTFTQLLPERFDDEEFRQTFKDLVGKEVKRIDGIVNQLLTFARPSKPRFESLNMHAVLSESLSLVGQEMRRSHIHVTEAFDADQDVVLGDADLLSQAFVNFFLNAQEAMVNGGQLSIMTTTLSKDVLNGALPPVNGNGNGRGSPAGANGKASDPVILIRISDTGCGIKDEDLVRIFDPFFTTKTTGTGLGLSVAHGIITEQGGVN
ncbi:MAG: ATP-binding protein, partial [Verrucomicrobia bacterium]|nr:ATP-binding protein [Verrucomicrobiota bacterium]